MTLHWWMHWFWVTALLYIYASGAFAAPQSEELQHITTDTDILPDRASRALYYPKPSPTTTKPTQPNTTNTTNQPTTETIKETENNKEEIDRSQEVVSLNDTNKNLTEIVHPSIQWTPVNTTEETNVEVAVKPVIQVAKTENRTTSNITVIPVHPNITGSQNATKKRNSVKPEFVKESNIQDAVSESKTDKPLSLETTLLQTRIPNLELYRRVAENSEGGGSMDTGAIAGISFAALVLAALAGSTAFVLYRRRYLNKPQTLNDKCSNPDSSGYLDDSTVRDNSEEMYSLDNDSFLNSLEAMTIQNYWTDTVKHTKL